MMRSNRQTLTVLLALMWLALPPGAWGQLPNTGDFMGSRAKDDTDKAAEAYGRGLRYKAKAEKEADLAKRMKLLEKAKKELQKAAGYVPNFDHYLALGQVHLRLGEKLSAWDACQRALSYKPEDPDAKECASAAQPDEAQAPGE